MNRETLEFPQTFNIKIIVENILTDKENRKNIEAMLMSENIKGTDWSSKLSREGKYLSYNVGVTVADKGQMERLYNKIRNIPNIKYAI